MRKPHWFFAPNGANATRQDALDVSFVDQIRVHRTQTRDENQPRGNPFWFAHSLARSWPRLTRSPPLLLALRTRRSRRLSTCWLDLLQFPRHVAIQQSLLHLSMPLRSYLREAGNDDDNDKCDADVNKCVCARYLSEGVE